MSEACSGHIGTAGLWREFAQHHLIPGLVLCRGQAGSAQLPSLAAVGLLLLPSPLRDSLLCARLLQFGSLPGSPLRL